MRRILVFLLLFNLIVNHHLFAQTELPDFGIFSYEEMNLKECSFDKEADAIILFDYGFSNYDDDYRLITSRRIRIKILNERGVENATIRIRFYSRDNFESIQNVEAVSYTPNEQGTYIASNLDRKSIYTEKENEYSSSIKFAIPNVKAGSIIEYKYESKMKNYGGLENWHFQSELPTVMSCYLLQMLPTAEFQYRVQKKREYPIVIKPIRDIGQTYFEMKNIPGLKIEPYMDAVSGYLQKVEFQLAGFINFSGSKQDVNTTWKDFAIDKATDKDLGAISKKDLGKIEEVKTLVAKETTEAGKISAVYNYVKNNFSCTGNYGKEAPDGFKKVLDKKAGNAGEINLLLVSLLQLYNIEAYPLLVAERDHKKVDTTYPYYDRFNKTAAYAVTTEGKKYILDVSDRFCPAGIIPYSLLNTYAFIIDKKKYQLLRVRSNGEIYNYAASIKATMNEKGEIKGMAGIRSYEYAKQIATEEIKKDKKKFISENILAKNKDLVVDSFYLENLDNETEPLVQHIKFKYDLNEDAGFILFNYNLFTGLQKSPFTKEERFTNVDFGCPFKFTLEAEINLPANAKIEELPKEKKVESYQKSISVTREIKREGNALLIKLNFSQTIDVVAAENYTALRSIYRDIVEMLNEPIVIKLK